MNSVHALISKPLLNLVFTPQMFFSFMVYIFSRALISQFQSFTLAEQQLESYIHHHL